MLCSDLNRLPLPGSPSTCALDTSITIIPSFVLLAFLALYIPAQLVVKRRTASSSSTIAGASKPSLSAYDYTYSSPSESPPRSTTPSLTRNTGELPKWAHWTYIALVVCLLALRVLEVVRLAVADMGVALLPVGIIANVGIIVMLACGSLRCEMGKTRSVIVSSSLVLYWAASTIFESIKVERLASYNTLNPMKGTAYPSSDWLLDNGCMLGLVVVFFFVEGWYLVQRLRSATLSMAEPVREMNMEISKPRPMSEYDPVTFLKGRDVGTAV